jgi:ribosome-associated heat shock protein Hsp15
MSDIEEARLDKWLWVARFYKTRSQAAEAIAGGKVHVNGQRVKPSKEVKPGMELSINKNGYDWKLTVAAISLQRRGAKEAEQLYTEDLESHAKRQQQVREQREMRELFPDIIDHKPNKKDRRLIHRFKQQGVED